jgi:hypothetical protein
MFDLMSKQFPLDVHKITFFADITSSNMTVNVFTKAGTFLGHETAGLTAWEHRTAMHVRSDRKKAVTVHLPSPIHIPGGDRVGVFVHTDSSSGMMFYTDDDGIQNAHGEAFEFDDELLVSVGKKCEASSPDFRRITESRRYFRGTFTYSNCRPVDSRRTLLQAPAPKAAALAAAGALVPVVGSRVLVAAALVAGDGYVVSGHENERLRIAPSLCVHMTTGAAAGTTVWVRPPEVTALPGIVEAAVESPCDQGARHPLHVWTLLNCQAPVGTERMGQLFHTLRWGASGTSPNVAPRAAGGSGTSPNMGPRHASGTSPHLGPRHGRERAGSASFVERRKTHAESVLSAVPIPANARCRVVLQLAVEHHRRRGNTPVYVGFVPANFAMGSGDEALRGEPFLFAVVPDGADVVLVIDTTYDVVSCNESYRFGVPPAAAGAAGAAGSAATPARHLAFFNPHKVQGVTCGIAHAALVCASTFERTQPVATTSMVDLAVASTHNNMCVSTVPFVKFRTEFHGTVFHGWSLHVAVDGAGAVVFSVVKDVTWGGAPMPLATVLARAHSTAGDLAVSHGTAAAAADLEPFAYDSVFDAGGAHYRSYDVLLCFADAAQQNDDAAQRTVTNALRRVEWRDHSGKVAVMQGPLAWELQQATRPAAAYLRRPTAASKETTHRVLLDVTLPSPEGRVKLSWQDIAKDTLQLAADPAQQVVIDGDDAAAGSWFYPFSRAARPRGAVATTRVCIHRDDAAGKVTVRVNDRVAVITRVPMSAHLVVESHNLGSRVAVVSWITAEVNAATQPEPLWNSVCQALGVDGRFSAHFVGPVPAVTRSSERRECGAKDPTISPTVDGVTSASRALLVSLSRATFNTMFVHGTLPVAAPVALMMLTTSPTDVTRDVIRRFVQQPLAATANGVAAALRVLLVDRA